MKPLADPEKYELPFRQSNFIIQFEIDAHDMAKKRKHTKKETPDKNSIEKLKDKMKHQTDALTKILKTIKDEEKKH